MFHRGLRRLRRDERGQALVIGAVAMLVLCIAVLTSVSIGHGVYSKVKLQDAADAQAYSIAVKEARAYNFLAYTNRAMVVHYNAMLTFMSYVSHALYLDATIGNAAKVLSYVPYIGPIFRLVEQAIEAWKDGCEYVAKFMVPVLTAMNIALWVAQETVLFTTLLDLWTTDTSDPIRLTDPAANAGYAMSLGSLGGISGVISNIGLNVDNSKNFVHPIDDGLHSGESMNWTDPTGLGKRSKLVQDNKLSDPDMAKYRLLMGNIANSARREWTAQGEDVLLVGRRWEIKTPPCLGIQIIIDKWANSQVKSFYEKAFGNKNVKDQLFASDNISIKIEAGCFITKTLFKFTFNIEAAADYADGFHRYALNSSRMGAKNNKDHNWLGITPFVHSDPSFKKPWSYHFSYPCNLVILTKDMMAKKEVFHVKTRYQEGEGTMADNGVLDMSWDKVGGDDFLGGLFRERTKGMMAMAVGRAIYHRPGEWQEEPNFFNPLWTARLAPMRSHWEWGSIRGEPEVLIAEFLNGADAINY